MKARVMRSTGSFYDVLAEDGQRYACRMRGKIRLDEIKETNPVAVGDEVKIELEHEYGSIVELLPRQNHILRQSVKRTGHAHVLAANVDQVVLIATVKQPRTSLGFIDRFWWRPNRFVFLRSLFSIKKISSQKNGRTKWPSCRHFMKTLV
jgi:ribosome biogenesis GTPase